MVSRLTRRVVALAALFPIAACGLSKPITHQEAAALIKESAAFTRPKSVRLPRQITVKSRWASEYGQERLLSVSDLAQIDPVVAILKLQGLVRVDESIYGPGRGALHLLVITPTDIEATALLPDASSTNSLDPQALMDARDERTPDRTYRMSDVKRDREWRIVVAGREFAQVDQIHNWKDPNVEVPVNELAIDFSWRWVPNDFGDMFDSRSSTFGSLPDSVQEAARTGGVRLNTSELMHSRAYLHRESDGQWKLRVIEWSFGRGNPM